MDKDQLPRIRMEETRMVDREALSGRLKWVRPSLRRWMPASLRKKLGEKNVHRRAPSAERTAPPGAHRRKMFHGDPNPPRTWVNTVGWQVSAAMLICLLVIGMKMMDAPMVKGVLEGLDYAVNTPTDFDSLGKLKFIDSMIDKSAEVFNLNSEEPDFDWPVRGEVTEGFSEEEDGSSGITIEAKGMAVTAALDGQVFYVGSNSRWGDYVRMRHADGWDTIYSHVTSSVKTGQDILGGEMVGWCDGDTVYFEIWRDGVPVDPEPLLPDPEENGS